MRTLKRQRRLFPGRISLACICFAGMVFGACESRQKNEQMTTMKETGLFSKGNKLPADWFTGDAYLTPLLAKDQNNEYAIGSVTFEPGARTNWHSHPKGQVLIVTEGIGFYQVKGEKAQIIRKGDVINIPENLVHWHGASANSGMVHIAITNYKGEENVTWLDPVSEQEYKEVNETSTVQ